MQFAKFFKGYLITSCKSSKGNQGPIFILRIFSILHAIANPYLHTAKKNLVPFRAETVGGK
jgi:hypothetical protein